jgi:hypothetical protein
VPRANRRPDFENRQGDGGVAHHFADPVRLDRHEVVATLDVPGNRFAGVVHAGRNHRLLGVAALGRTAAEFNQDPVSMHAVILHGCDRLLGHIEAMTPRGAGAAEDMPTGREQVVEHHGGAGEGLLCLQVDLHVEIDVREVRAPMDLRAGLDADIRGQLEISDLCTPFRPPRDRGLVITRLGHRVDVQAVGEIVADRDHRGKIDHDGLGPRHRLYAGVNRLGLWVFHCHVRQGHESVTHAAPPVSELAISWAATRWRIGHRTRIVKAVLQFRGLTAHPPDAMRAAETAPPSRQSRVAHQHRA